MNANAFSKTSVKLEKCLVTKVPDKENAIVYCFSDRKHYRTVLTEKKVLEVSSIPRNCFTGTLAFEKMSGYCGNAAVVSHSCIPVNKEESPFYPFAQGERFWLLLTWDGEIRFEAYPIGWDLYRGGFVDYIRDGCVHCPFTYEDYKNLFCHTDSELVGSKSFALRPCFDDPYLQKTIVKLRTL